jgi:transposase
VADLFEHSGPGKPPRYARRTLVDACCYVVRTGCSWRMLPKDLPPWQDVYAHFRRWTDKNLFETMHDRLRAMWRIRQGRNEAPTAAIVDSQSVKTSAQGGPKDYDAGKKVKGRKRHLVVDVLGLVLAVLVHPADIQDRDGAEPVVKRAVEKYPTLQKLYVDSAYSGGCAQRLRTEYALDVEVVRRPGCAGPWSDSQLALFPTQVSPFPILPRRWVVERTHSWIERPRRLSKDYDRRLDVSTSWIWLAETRILLRRVSEPDAA